MKYIKITYFLIFITACNLQIKGQKLHTIPTQCFDFYQSMEFFDIYDLINNNYYKDTVRTFEVSDFITYKEYKKYLTAIQKDSSKQFYTSQFPDTSITIDNNIYNEYITNKEYDKFPVVGISWNNAMNYCKWKTLKDNKKGKVKFIYRLPMHSEWLSILSFVKENDIQFEIDNKYSDWTLNTFDETAYNFSYDLDFDYTYFHKKSDPLVLKRKRVVGESYLYRISSYRYGYSTIGYRQISFRLVKTDVNQQILKYWGIEE